ncbi:MAG: TauD/TfdA family dioxygenase [Pseudomonadales bacterium]
MRNTPSHLNTAEQAQRYFSARRHTRVPSRPLNSPAAWLGDDIRSAIQDPDNEIVYRLTTADLKEIEQALQATQTAETSPQALSKDEFPLPGMQSRFRRWQSELRSGRGFVLIKGVPVDSWSTAKAERFFWCFGQHLGIPGLQNPHGDLLGHVIDTGDASTDPLVRLYRTSANINYHCDGADVVGLLCLHNSTHGGVSRIASSVTVFNELLAQAPKLANRLCSPIRMDRRNEERPGEKPYSVLQPACYDGKELRTFYHSDYFRSVTRYVGALPDDEQALLDAYEAIAERPEVRFEMAFEPGDIQLLSNHTVVHARTAYNDNAEVKRHLLRLWLSLSPESK